MEAVRGLGRPGHLAEGDHIWSRRRVRCLRVTKTLVGRIANRPKGSPIVRADTTADSEIAGVADHRLGSEGASLLQILLDATGLVAAADLGVDALSKDFGREGPQLSGLPFATWAVTSATTWPAIPRPLVTRFSISSKPGRNCPSPRSGSSSWACSISN